jgi:hypothetical protein
MSFVPIGNLNHESRVDTRPCIRLDENRKDAEAVSDGRWKVGNINPNSWQYKFLLWMSNNHDRTGSLPDSVLCFTTDQ